METSLDGRYLLPDMSFFAGATPAEKSYAERYTRIQPVDPDDLAGEYSYWLVVGNQFFRMYGDEENAEHASWHCWMMAKALLRVTP